MRWRERGDRIALATVIDVQRSAPRPPGAKMAVNEHGEIAGSVSGGCVEGAVVEIADGILRGDPPQLVHFGIADSDAWDVGLAVRRRDRRLGPGVRARPLRGARPQPAVARPR